VRLLPPVLSGTNLILRAVGGTTNATFVLYSTTSPSTPWGLWTPVLTNHFDQFRDFNYTNVSYSAAPREYFRLVVR
jgi:hypothetical protein